MADPSAPGSSNGNAPLTGGASVQPQYTKRIMKLYAINETEAATISSMNSQATFFFSLASFIASAAISIYTNAVFYTDLTPAGQLARYYVAPAGILLSLCFLCYATYIQSKRKRIWLDIKSEAN